MESPPSSLPASRTTPAMSIPYRTREGSASDSNFFVGSPEQIDPEFEPDPPQRTSRPLIGTRSISSPQVSPVRKRVNATPRTGQHTPRGHQWSVFGQLMENEAIPASASAQRYSHRRSGRRSNVTGSWIEGSPASSILGRRSVRTQSPFSSSSVTRTESDDSDDDDDLDNDDDDDKSDSGDSTYDPDTSDSESTVTATPPLKSKWAFPDIPVVWRNILKCAIAYFIASLFTFSPHLSGLISDLASYGPGKGERKPLPSGHMVATVAVYFNPAKTMGAMVEADLFCLFGFAYAAFVCLASMTMFWWLDVKPGWEWLADVLAIVWIGVSMSFIAWMKVWMGNPQFNTACSMISLIIFVVVVKEGGLYTLLSMAFIIFCGSAISNVICYLIWPQSATANLQTNMTKTLDSFSTLLDMLTSTFLLEEPMHRVSQEKLQKAVENHQNSFTSLKKNLKEAKSEWFFAGKANTSSTDSPLLDGPSQVDGRKKAYEDAVDCLNRLAQHLNGLRSGIRLQYDLTKAGVVKRMRHSKRTGKNKIVEGDVVEDDEETAMLKAAATMFGELVDDLGPPLKALSGTCASSLKRLRESFVQSQRRGSKNEFQPQEFLELVDNIGKALMRFESTSNHAVMRLYRKSDVAYMDSANLSTSRMSVYSANGKADNLMLMSPDNEHVFLVYFFIFTLEEFATELTSLVDAMERIYNYERNRLTWKGWFRRSFNAMRARWRKFTSWRSVPSHGRRPGLKHQLSSFILPNRRKRPTFPKVRPHAPNTVLTPARSNLSFVGRIKQMLWSVGKRMGERDIKYAIKAGMATALLASPAFFDATRPIFLRYNGDWALVSFFVVISPTIGATNFLSVHRVLWTLFGATLAAAVYELFSESAVILAIFGFFFSIPCFYFIVTKPPHASAARFALLTYNLTCLYCFNVRQSRDVSVVYVAYHRAIAVTVGVLYAAFISRFWWPAEARRELGKALSEFCLNIGWLYTRLVASNSFAPEYREEPDEDESHDALVEGVNLVGTQTGLTRLNNSIQEFMAMELHLQIKLIELQGLLSQTQHEPRLKGPFPVQLYRGVLISLQTILDKLHSMRCVTTREEWYTSVRQDFILPVNKERHAMVGNIILYFSTLASAFQLKMPLPPYLPPAEESRQRLVDAIRKLDVVRNRDVKGSRQLLFFAYALTMKGVTQELETLGKTLQEAFGVIGQTPEEFEALFADNGRRDSFA